MKNKMILVLSGLIVVNTVLGKVGEEDVFETKDVFGSNEAQPVHQETITTNEEINTESTITNDELKVQVIHDWWDALLERNGCKIQKGMDQYILEDTWWYKGIIKEVLAKLRPLYTDKAKKLGKKPIVFKGQKLTDYDEVIEETDEFSIESFWVPYCRDTDEFGKCYDSLIKYGKSIVFKEVPLGLKDEIEKKYELSNCKIIYHTEIKSFDEYLKLTKMGINLKISTATVNFKPFSDQNLKKKLELFLKSIEAKSKEEIKKGAELLSGLLNKSIVDYTIFECFEIILKEDWKTYDKDDKGTYLSDKIRDLIQHIEKAEKFPITDEKELRKQLYAYTRDNRIETIYIKNLWWSNSYKKGTVSIPIEYASCLRLNWEMPLVNPKNTETILFVLKDICMLENVTCDTLFLGDLKCYIGKNVSCKTIICLDSYPSLNYLIDFFVETKNKIKNLETIWLGVDSKKIDKIKKGVALDEEDENFEKLIKRLEEKNISLCFYDPEKLDKAEDYIDYIEAKNIVHLSGYVNVKNKPNELSDEEWNQVLVLKQKVKEIIKEIQTEGVKIPEKLK